MSAHTNQEKAKALARMTLRVTDVKILLDCGSDRANQMIRGFRSWFSETYGYELYDKQVPTAEFIKYARIPEKRILQYAEKGY